MPANSKCLRNRMQKVDALILWGVAFLSAFSLSVKGSTMCADLESTKTAKPDMNELTTSEAATSTMALTSTEAGPAATTSLDTSTSILPSSGATLVSSPVSSMKLEPSTSASPVANTSMPSSETTMEENPITTESPVMSPVPSASSNMVKSSMSISTVTPTTPIPFTTTTVADLPMSSHMTSSGTSSLTSEIRMTPLTTTLLDTTTHVHLKTTIMPVLPTSSTESPGYNWSPLTLTAIVVGVTVGLVALLMMIPFCIVFVFVMCN